MSNIKQNLKSVASIILGILMFLISFSYYEAGGSSIALGVFLMLFGSTYILFAILSILNLVKGTTFAKLNRILLLSLLPLYLLVYDIVLFAGGAGNVYAIIGWIIVIMRMIVSLSIVVFSIITEFNDNVLFLMIRNLFLLLIAAVFALSLVFTFTGGTRTLGNLSLFDLITYSAYILIGLLSIKNEDQEVETESDTYSDIEEIIEEE
ncbi:MAG: hypothetical protein K6G38_01445 [Gammaproteobacteria bacterium]|nr:hypothetical protein [Gammaproteobacteria bacterium]